VLRRSRADVAVEDPTPAVGDRQAMFDIGQIEDGVRAWVTEPRPMLGEVLLTSGIISPDQLTDALARQRIDGGRIGQVLGLDEAQLAQGLSSQLRIRVADLRAAEPQRTALDLVGEEMCRRLRVLPLRVDDEKRVWLVTSDPLDADAISELVGRVGRIGVLIGVASEIDRLLDREFDALSDADIYIRALELADSPSGEGSETGSLAVDENAPVVQVINRIVTQGVRDRASDIHIESQEHGIRVRYRIDGALTDIIQLPVRMGPAIISRVKVLAELNIVERRRPQDGQFSTVVDGRPIDVRTSTVATVHGEKVVLRLLDKQRSLVDLRQLGMTAEVIPDYLAMVQAPLGMVLCTGPTGSGKTTTLYSTLAEVNDPQKNVVTIEDPVEYQFDGVNQMQISESGGLTFAAGLRGMLRQDPDVILVGEIRDIETARIATQASLTGHLVLSSLHSVDAVSAIHRFIDMGIEPFLIASAINGVVGQRLLRRICSGCAEPYRPSDEHRRIAALSMAAEPQEWIHGVGCSRCSGSGYYGRVGVYELLVVDDGMRELIVDRSTAELMRRHATAAGMISMHGQAMRLVGGGVTTVEEVVRTVAAA